MRILLPDPPPPPFDEVLERRRRWGAGTLDEVWEGVVHLIPPPTVEHQRIVLQLAELLRPLADQAGLITLVGPFGVGDRSEHRVPDGGLHRPGAKGVWNPTAALVFEVVSPGDETWEKLPFYAAHHVDELLIVDPQDRRVHWLALAGAEYRPIERSKLIESGAAELARKIDWPS